MSNEDLNIILKFNRYIREKDYPCSGAKAALKYDQLRFYIAGNMNSANDDRRILRFLYNFIDEYRISQNLYHTAVIFFREPEYLTENQFEKLLWERLQSLADLDSENYPYDKRVNPFSDNSKFSYSIKEEAFFINGMYQGSIRNSRKFEYPCLVMNPHQQFEKLKALNKYFSMRKSIRQKDLKYCGSPNVMARDFYFDTEAFQYSGKVYDRSWKCPLHTKHNGQSGK